MNFNDILFDSTGHHSSPPSPLRIRVHGHKSRPVHDARQSLFDARAAFPKTRDFEQRRLYRLSSNRGATSAWQSEGECTGDGLCALAGLWIDVIFVCLLIYGLLCDSFHINSI